MKKKEGKYFYTYSPINRYGKISDERKIQVLGVSFEKKKDALKWLKDHGDILAKSAYDQFKDELDYISGFAIHLFKDTKVVRTFVMKEKKPN